MRKITLLCIAFMACYSFGFAQFTITNQFKTADATGLQIGDNAYLTAAKSIDPNGNGWLRLTEAEKFQKGYMYVKQSFPTTLGVLVDFEYVDWRNKIDPGQGADGFSIFLFDGSVSESDFKLGGYGGSLGYATFGNPKEPGLTGGYIGLGFDAYGSYAIAFEGRNGGTGPSQYKANSVVLRGPTNDADINQSNIYLTRVDLGDRTGESTNNFTLVRSKDEIDYNTVVPVRPDPNVFYRRVQVSITRVAADYLVSIGWRKENETTFTHILDYTMPALTYPLPPTFKLGFAASTGGSFNFQEIRNVILTTPGNLRVDSRSDEGYICNERKSAVSFNIEVTNDTPADLTDIDFDTKIVDNNNNIIDISQFKITSVTLSNAFTSSTLPASNFNSNQISGKVGLARNTSGIVTITGEHQRNLPLNSIFKAVSNVNTTQVADIDATNNTASSDIQVRKCSSFVNPRLPSKAQ